jgi:hypothetical protein
MGKTLKYTFAFCAAGDAGEKETFVPILNFKYFIQAVKFRWSSQKLLWPPSFPSISCGNLETWCGLLPDHITHDQEPLF